jgi:hypothetical protein
VGGWRILIERHARVVASWDERAGRVSRSFNDWYWIDREQRAFLRVGLRLIPEAYERIWRELGEQPSDGEDDLVEEFEKEVEGLWDREYAWMQCAANGRSSSSRSRTAVSFGRHGGSSRSPSPSSRSTAARGVRGVAGRFDVTAPSI